MINTPRSIAQAFYDEPCSQESPNQTRERLADLASEFVDRSKFLKAVKVGKSNGGTPGTSPFFFSILRFHRILTSRRPLSFSHGKSQARDQVWQAGSSLLHPPFDLCEIPGS